MVCVCECVCVCVCVCVRTHGAAVPFDGPDLEPPFSTVPGGTFGAVCGLGDVVARARDDGSRDQHSGRRRYLFVGCHGAHSGEGEARFIYPTTKRGMQTCSPPPPLCRNHHHTYPRYHTELTPTPHHTHPRLNHYHHHQPTHTQPTAHRPTQAPANAGRGKRSKALALVELKLRLPLPCSLQKPRPIEKYDCW